MRLVICDYYVADMWILVQSKKKLNCWDAKIFLKNGKYWISRKKINRNWQNILVLTRNSVENNIRLLFCQH